MNPPRKLTTNHMRHKDAITALGRLRPGGWEGKAVPDTDHHGGTRIELTVPPAFSDQQAIDAVKIAFDYWPSLIVRVEPIKAQKAKPVREFPLVVKDWTLKRSGHSMTVTGKDELGAPARIAGVYSVSPAPNGGCAWGKDAAGKVIAALI